LTRYAGPLMPVTVVNTLGRVMPNRVVTVHRQGDDALAALYLDVNRTLAPTPYRTDGDGNLTGYFAEPGHYMIRSGDLPEVATAAVIAPEEADAIAKSPGPIGPQGPEGYGTRRFQGHGPPTTIIGSRQDDEYLDLLTGDLYTLTP
jgi:hypothetical protein